MTGIKQVYSDTPIYDKFFVISGSASAVSFPSGTAKMFRMIADSSNDAPFMIGNYLRGVGMYPLYAGGDIEWSPAPASGNMAEMVHSNVSGSAEKLYVWMKD